MREILLSTALVSLLLLMSGCDDTPDTSSSTLSTSSETGREEFTIQNVDPINIIEGNDKIASLSAPSGSIVYTITGGDTLYFKIVDKTLYFKTAPQYIDGNNQYKVEVTAKDQMKPNAKATKLKFTINVLQSGSVVVTKDTTAPVIENRVSAEIDSQIVLARDNVGVTTIRLSGADAGNFTVSGTSVRTPATAGTYMLTVTASDAAGNESSGNVTVTVTAPATSGTLTWSSVEDNRFTWAEADAGCRAMAPMGSWRLPTIEELRSYSDTLRTLLPSSARTSVIWSADEALLDVNGNERKLGWGYFMVPADSTAQLTSEKYYFTCVKSN